MWIPGLGLRFWIPGLGFRVPEGTSDSGVTILKELLSFKVKPYGFGGNPM